ncbi:MAG TPA: 2-hydroxyacyl-CoA dehydratase family protein [archaeon]|nr:2-hydroxyacyl-CoA dehydratase family protein [archaeon]
MASPEKRNGKPRRRVGFIGCPPEEVIARYRGEELLDLDNAFPGVLASSAEEHLPANTCSIIKRILANVLALKPELIIFDDGYSKCDNARFLGLVLEKLLPRVKLVKTQNDNLVPGDTIISDSYLPLPGKVDLILRDLISPIDKKVLKPCAKPPAAFWGVPCADLSIYGLFPPGTQVLGWLRCFENRTPADIEAECWVPPDVPTVFFAQTFCSKNILAKDLARRHNGLYVDSDGTLTRSERAKIEAFLHFRREGH